MAKFTARIIDIESLDNLNLVHFDFYGYKLVMMSLELDQSIIIGRNVVLTCKSSAITFSKSFKGQLSISNRLVGNIVSINSGKLLSSIEIKVEKEIFETFITNKTLKEMALEISDSVDVFINPSSLFIIGVVDE